MNTILKFLQRYIINSRPYYHLYYKHTAKHKQDMKNTYDRSMGSRKQIIGK